MGNNVYLDKSNFNIDYYLKESSCKSTSELCSNRNTTEVTNNCIIFNKYNNINIKPIALNSNNNEETKIYSHRNLNNNAPFKLEYSFEKAITNLNNKDNIENVSYIKAWRYKEKNYNNYNNNNKNNNNNNSQLSNSFVYKKSYIINKTKKLNSKNDSSFLNVITEPFNFLSKTKDLLTLSNQESYLVLYILNPYINDNKKIGNLNCYKDIPNEIIEILDSTKNVTNRGLEYAFSTNIINNNLNFLINSNNNSYRQNSKYCNKILYVLFVWDGQYAKENIKAQALLDAYKLDKKLKNQKFLYSIIENKSSYVLYNNVFSDDEEYYSDKKEDNLEKLKVNNNDRINLLKYLNLNLTYKKKKDLRSFKNFKNMFLNKLNANNNLLKSNNSDKCNSLCNKPININDINNTNKYNYYYNLFIVDMKVSSSNMSSSRKEPSSTRKNKNSFNINNSNNNSLKVTAKKSIESVISEPLELEEESDEDFDIDNDIFIRNSYNYSGNKTSDINTINKDNIVKNKLSIKLTDLEDTTADSGDKITFKQAINSTIKKLPTASIIKPLNIPVIDEENTYQEKKRFNKECSEILPNFLYLSGQVCSSDIEILRNLNITYIINAAAEICESLFRSEIKYLDLYLRDYAGENIECCFYKAYDFIEEAKKNNCKILVHCVQGISRSSAIVISYIMLTKKLNYDDAVKFVENKRSIISPNLGFSLQLQDFYSRLYSNYIELKKKPKIFAIGLLNKAYKIIVARYLNYCITDNQTIFDPRGVYIICSEDSNYLLFSDIIDKKYDHNNCLNNEYIEYAKYYLKNKINVFEKSSNNSELIYIRESEIKNYNASKNLINNLKLAKLLNLLTYNNILYNFSIIEKYDSWYIYEPKELTDYNKNTIKDTNFNNDNNSQIKNNHKLEFDNNNKNKINFSIGNNNNTSLTLDEKFEIINKDNKFTENKKLFFIFDDYKPITFLDLDNLDIEDIVVVVYIDYLKNIYKLYIWNSEDLEYNQDELNDFIKNIINNHFDKNDRKNNIQIIKEFAFKESEEFLELF